MRQGNFTQLKRLKKVEQFYWRQIKTKLNHTDKYETCEYFF